VEVFQALAAGDVAIAPSEAWRGRLDPAIASPLTGQIPTGLRQAVMGNVLTALIFRGGEARTSRGEAQEPAQHPVSPQP